MYKLTVVVRKYGLNLVFATLYIMLALSFIMLAFYV